MAINSRAAMAKNFRIDQIVSIQNIATRYLFLRDTYIYIFLFPPFFPSPPFFIIRFSCHEVRMKKHRKYALASLANWPGCACIYRTYIPEMRETLMFVIYIYFVILSPVHQ